MGTERIIQIGCGGGLQPEIELGDIMVSEGVLCVDGSAKLYKQESDFVEFDRALTKKVIEKLKGGNTPYHLGKTVCTYDILLWEPDIFNGLSGSGYIGTDMESGGVGSAARFFDVPAASFYVCSDNSASGKDLFHKQNREEQEKVKKGFQTVLDIALDL
jgi:uridine phosphorylase